MFKPEITSHDRHGVPAQSIYITGHGQYDARTDTLALVTEHLAHLTTRELRSRMTRAYRTFEGVNPELASVRRAELLFIAAEYPSLYLPGMVQALGLTVDTEGRYWVPATDEDGQAAETTEPTTPAPVPAFVADPTEPTDAELAAAIQRGLATGQLVDATDWLAAQRAQDAIQASAARHGHATTCTAHGGRDLAVCDPADCDEAALAASFTVSTTYPAKPAPVTTRDIGSRAYFAGLSVTVEAVDNSGPYPVALVRYAATNTTERVPADNVKLARADATQTLRCRVCGHVSTVPAGQDATDRLCCICFERGSYSFLVPVTQDADEDAAKAEHDEAGPAHRAWCAGPHTHLRASRSATVAQRPRARRGHFHDLAGLTGYCQDPTCTRIA